MQARVQALKTLALARMPWDAVCDRWARLIPGDDPLFNLDSLKSRTESGLLTHHAVMQDGKRIGFVLTAIESGSNAKELVIVASYIQPGANASDDLSACEAIARAENCDSIRIHTVRPGLVRKLTQNHGFRLSEVILRKTL